MVKISAYGDLSFLPCLITQHFESILARLSLGSTHAVWKYRAMSERDQVYADEYNFFVVKTVWMWKRIFHFNLQIKKVYYFLPNLIHFVYFRAGFSDGPQTNSSYVFAHDYTFFRYRIGGVWTLDALIKWNLLKTATLDVLIGWNI